MLGRLVVHRGRSCSLMLSLVLCLQMLVQKREQTLQKPPFRTAVFLTSLQPRTCPFPTAPSIRRGQSSSEKRRGGCGGRDSAWQGRWGWRAASSPLKAKKPEQTPAWGHARRGRGQRGPSRWAPRPQPAGCRELRVGRGARHQPGAAFWERRGCGVGQPAPTTTGRCGGTILAPCGGAAAAPPLQKQHVAGSRPRKCPSAAGCPCPARIHLLLEEPPGRVPGPGVGPRVPPPSHSFGCGAPGPSAEAAPHPPGVRVVFFFLLLGCPSRAHPAWSVAQPGLGAKERGAMLSCRERWGFRSCCCCCPLSYLLGEQMQQPKQHTVA